MRAALVTLLLCACGPEVVVTPCGLWLSPDTDVARVLDIERASVDWRLVTCGALDRWQVTVADSETWVTRDGHVGGQMNCDSRGILVGPSFASLAHEFAHVAECPTHNYEHSGWKSLDAQGLSTFGRIEKAMSR